MFKKCKLCGQNFDAKGNKNYCDDCKENFHVECQFCHIKFKFTNRYKLSAYNNTKNFFCSSVCSNKFKGNTTIKLAEKETTKQCRRCGAEYTGTTFSKLCPECSKKECSICGTKFEEGYRGYCSEKCYNQSINNSIDKANKAQIDKYGGIGFENKIIRDKAKETIINKYGVENVFKSKTVQEQIIETNLAKFGTEHPVKLPEVQAKIKKTNLKRYGVINPAQLPEIQEKIKKNKQEQLGNQYFDNLETSGKKSISDLELLEKIKTKKVILGRPLHPREILTETDYKSISSIYQRLAHWHKLGINIKELVILKESYYETIIEDFLKANNIKYEKNNRTLIKPLELDFYLPDYAVAIEVNDFITHNSSYNPYGEPKDKNYHLDKTILCRNVGIRLIHAWQNFITDARQFNVLKNVILNACGKNKRKIYARDTIVEVRPAIDLKNFFETNNIWGYRGAQLAYTLKHKKTGEVVMAYLIGKALFGRGSEKPYDAEIIRGASLLGVTVVGGASKLWNYLIRDTKYNSIVYYVDLNLYNGNSLSFLSGTRLIKEQPSFKNYFVNEDKLKNRNPAKHKEISQMTDSNEVWQVWDAGNQVWVWTRNDIELTSGTIELEEK